MSNPSNQYSWRVNHLIIRDQEPYQRVVDLVNVTVRAERAGQSVETDHEIAIAAGDLAESFTPFDQLTEQLVMSWVMASFNVESLQALINGLDTALDLKITPPLRQSGVLPWDESTAGAPDIPLNFQPPIWPGTEAE